MSEFDVLLAAAIDLNGGFRGKRMPGRDLAKTASGLRMPFSALNVDITGADIENSPLVFESGDADGRLVATNRGPVPMPWLCRPSALVPLMMTYDDGTPFETDARQALVTVLDRFAARGWRVQAAAEMEFTLVDDSADALQPPASPWSGRHIGTGEVLSLSELECFDAFLSDIETGAEAMGIEIGSVTSESGLGQLEVTLNHGDALWAADNCVFFKLLARGVARKHGMAATFMAKPYLGDAGNGMHVHASVLDAHGHNVFDNGGPDGTEDLHQAIAGSLALMPDATLIFAPFRNSYARLVPGNHAPTAASWGYDNRTVALRVPGGASKARRLEHRVAGGDTNPYLVLATILGGMIDGIDHAEMPPAPLSGNAYDVPGLPQLMPSWEAAIDRAARSERLARVLSPKLIDNLIRTKRQDMAVFSARGDQPDWPLLLEAV